LLPEESAPFWHRELKNNFIMKKKSKIENFNIVINGVGGQGLITLLNIISQAGQKEGYDLATSELHGLSQRGGSVEVHIRFGKKIYSPLVRQGGADLIISLEAQESLKSCYYASKDYNPPSTSSRFRRAPAKTIFLVNNFFSQISSEKKIYSEKDILKNLQKFSQKAIFIDANQTCQRELKNEVAAGIYLLGYAIYNKFFKISFSEYIFFCL
jgi:indolepyruvate ferredoxin oxidoreductase beta subunit